MGGVLLLITTSLAASIMQAQPLSPSCLFEQLCQVVGIMLRPVHTPLPDRRHFKHVFVPSVYLPLFITSCSLVLMPS